MMELKVNLYKGQDTAGSLPSTNNDAKNLICFPVPYLVIKSEVNATVEI